MSPKDVQQILFWVGLLTWMLLKYHFQDKYKISNKTMDSVAMAACAAMAVADFFIGYYLGFLLMSAAVVYMGYGYYKAERKEKAQ